MSITAQLNGNAALADQNESLSNVNAPAKGPVQSGNFLLKLAKGICDVSYRATEVAENLIEGVVNIGKEAALPFRAFLKDHGTAVVVSGAALGAAVGMEQKTDGANYTNPLMTRAQATTDMPLLDGNLVSASNFLGGFPNTNNASITYLWDGPSITNPTQTVSYFAFAGHEVQNGLSFGNIYLGRDYRNNPGPAEPILSMTLSSNADMGVLTTPAIGNLMTPRSPNARLVGLGDATDPTNGYTVFASFLGNLDFLNQATGSNITADQVLSGQSIIGAPSNGDEIWSLGLGAYTTQLEGRNVSDGLPGEYEGTFLPNGVGLFGQWSDPTRYFAMITNAGLYSGDGASGDSGGPAIIDPIATPEPGTLTMFILGVGICLLRFQPAKQR